MRFTSTCMLLILVTACATDGQLVIAASEIVLRPLDIGPMIGITTDKSFRLWGRGGKSSTGVARFRSAKTGKNTAGKWSEIKRFNMLEDSDYTGTVEFNHGINPDTLYDYQIGYTPDTFMPVNEQSAWDELFQGIETYQVRSAPAKGSGKAVRFIFGSCRDQSSYSENGEDTFRNIGALLNQEKRNQNTPQSGFIIQAGDQVYADNSLLHKVPLVKTWVRKDTDDEFWQLYRTAFGNEAYSDVLKQLPTFMILDDHEVYNNWKKGELDNGNKHMNAAYNPGIIAYIAYQGSLNLPAESIKAKRLWYNFEYGDSDFFVLDTRSGNEVSKKLIKASEAGNEVTDPKILDNEQFKALKQWLLSRKSHDGVKFIVSPVPVFPDTLQPFKGEPEDKWGGGVWQRHDLLEFIRTKKIRKVVFLSGDVHVSTIAELVYCESGTQCDEDFRIYNILSSPFNWSLIFGVGPQESSLDLDENFRALSRKPFGIKAVASEGCSDKNTVCMSSSTKEVNSPSSNYYVRRYKTNPVTPRIHKQNNFSRITSSGNMLTVEFFSGHTGKLLESSTIWFK